MRNFSMTPVVLDTSAYSATGRGDIQPKELRNANRLILLPVIVLGELMAGFRIGNQNQREHNEQLLRRFINQPNVSVINVTNKTVEHFADIFYELRSSGKAIGLNDIWIASLVREHQATLLTLDKGFSYVKGLDLAKI